MAVLGFIFLVSPTPFIAFTPADLIQFRSIFRLALMAGVLKFLLLDHD